jgi:hypothetical protein
VPNRSSSRPFSGTLLLATTLLAGTLLAGCADDPFAVEWQENPREAVLYSLARPDFNRPSAFEMLGGTSLALESPLVSGRWDFALDTRQGTLVLLPPRSLGVLSSAAIAPLPNTDFFDVREAPADTLAFISRAPVPVQMGTTYVIRTHEQFGFFGQACVYYGKMTPLDPDPVNGVLRFRFDTSPECNNRSLVPRRR